MAVESVTAPVPVESRQRDDNMSHIQCRCTPGVGLCGVDCRGSGFVVVDGSSEPVECVVCAEMDAGSCSRCGL